MDIGVSGASDPEVRAAAIREGRVLITLDADFGNILRYPVLGTPGVARRRLHPPSEIKIREALGRCLAKLENVELAGKLVVADEDKIRVRG